jgi:hypothetical protein
LEKYSASEKPDSIRILKVNWQQVYKDRLL